METSGWPLLESNKDVDKLLCFLVASLFCEVEGFLELIDKHADVIMFALSQCGGQVFGHLISEVENASDCGNALRTRQMRIKGGESGRQIL